MLSSYSLIHSTHHKQINLPQVLLWSHHSGGSKVFNGSPLPTEHSSLSSVWYSKPSIICPQPTFLALSPTISLTQTMLQTIWSICFFFFFLNKNCFSMPEFCPVYFLWMQVPPGFSWYNLTQLKHSHHLLLTQLSDVIAVALDPVILCLGHSWDTQQWCFALRLDGPCGDSITLPTGNTYPHSLRMLLKRQRGARPFQLVCMHSETDVIFGYAHRKIALGFWPESSHLGEEKFHEIGASSHSASWPYPEKQVWEETPGSLYLCLSILSPSPRGLDLLVFSN